MNEQRSTIEKGWAVDRLPDLSGRNYLITGANSGIGYEAAAHLRRKNANVIVAARSTTKGQTAVSRLNDIPSAGSVTLIALDLANTESIREAAAAVRSETESLDAVINNAGVMQTPKQETADGFELQFGTNHLGHFLLNYLLFDLVEQSNGRIVPVSSIVHLRGSGIHFDDPMLTSGYSPSRAYIQSKLANLMYGFELTRRLSAAGSNVMCVNCHPGYSATNLQSAGPTGALKFVYRFTNLLAQSARDGAVPEALAAAGVEAQHGAYYGPTGLGEAIGPVGDGCVNRAARDVDAGQRLWQLSEELLGITWDI